MVKPKRYGIQYLETLEATEWQDADEVGHDRLDEAFRARSAADRRWSMARIWDRHRQCPISDAQDAAEADRS